MGFANLCWAEKPQLDIPAMDEWGNIEETTGWKIPAPVRQACIAPKLVTIPAGRELYAAGPAIKERMEWGAFEENDIGWYLQGNQLVPSWYIGTRTERVELYEYRVVLQVPTLAVMSKVGVQPGAPGRREPFKYQYYTPVGLGKPARGRLLGHLEVDGRFTPGQDPPSQPSDDGSTRGVAREISSEDNGLLCRRCDCDSFLLRRVNAAPPRVLREVVLCRTKKK